MKFLDVASGTGALSIPAARLGADVLSTDLSPVMLERLRERARREGLEIETRVMNGAALELEDSSFDLSGSQFGVMLFPDMPRGISEMARVTKPGGCVLMNVYGPPDKVDFFVFFVNALKAVVPGFEGPPEPPLPFQLRDPRKLRQELANAGLKSVRVETIIETIRPESGSELWSWLMNSNPVVGQVLAELNVTDEQLPLVEQALEQMVRERAGGSGPAALSCEVHIGVGTK
jgi:ubiquinone/menaquinone biosynthesis C-methylase UbiE